MPARPDQPDAAPVPLAEVRYHLPGLLREVDDERATEAFTMERLDQVEITKLFAKPRSRRALRPKK